ncbi:MAG: heme exporter protein CcmD [Gammaproteobacteria bacterium]|nr:heme exporter protein CcmD [Gammaproteobacteria bacterium]
MNPAEFFSMGGYAFYVWGSYAVTAVLMLLEVALVMRRRRTLLGRLGRIHGDAQRGGGAQTGNETQA